MVCNNYMQCMSPISVFFLPSQSPSWGCPGWGSTSSPVSVMEKVLEESSWVSDIWDREWRRKRWSTVGWKKQTLWNGLGWFEEARQYDFGSTLSPACSGCLYVNVWAACWTREKTQQSKIWQVLGCLDYTTPVFGHCDSPYVSLALLVAARFSVK